MLLFFLIYDNKIENMKCEEITSKYNRCKINGKYIYNNKIICQLHSKKCKKNKLAIIGNKYKKLKAKSIDFT